MQNTSTVIWLWEINFGYFTFVQKRESVKKTSQCPVYQQVQRTSKWSLRVSLDKIKVCEKRKHAFYVCAI